MTKAEAIRILEQSCPKRPQKLWSIKRKEAIKMAIEALSAQLDNNSTKVDNKNDELSCSEEPNGSDLVKESGDLVKDLVKDTIYRQDAIDVAWKEPSYTDPLNVLAEVRDRIKALPSAQPERKKGEWITNSTLINCSVCGHCSWSKNSFEDLVKSFNFCPNCGADMRGEGK